MSTRVASALFAAIFLIIFGLDEAFGALEYGSCPSSEQGTIKGTCEMSCNRETGECTTTEEIISCDCAGERRTESYVYSYQDGSVTGAVGRRKRQAGPTNTCDQLPLKCESCKKSGQRGKSSASAKSESRNSC